MGIVLANCSEAGSLKADVTPADNPYLPISARNVFGLAPIPSSAPVDVAPTVPRARITPNGIMTLFGNAQVLFKVLEAPVAGQPPAVEQSYVLAVGESHDGIEVKKIDEASAIITFDNHGIIQEIPLSTGTAASDGQTASTSLASSSITPGTFGSTSGMAASGRTADPGLLSSTTPGMRGATSGAAGGDGQTSDSSAASLTTPGADGTTVRQPLVRKLNLPIEYPAIGTPGVPAPDISL